MDEEAGKDQAVERNKNRKTVINKGKKVQRLEVTTKFFKIQCKYSN